MNEGHAHKHWGCPECGNIIHDEANEYSDGDACPKCIVGKLAEAHPMPSPEEMTQAMQKPMMDLMERTERERAERSDKQHAQAIAVAQRTASAMEAIAASLATLASAISHDDLGNAAFRIQGDLIGGEGDIPVE